MVKRLDEPLSFERGRTWANRFALAPLTNKQSNDDGTLGDDEFRWLTARALGGFGMVMTCATYVHRSGRAWSGQLGISGDEHLAGLTRLAHGIHEAGSVALVQLHHGGRRALDDEGPRLAPWDSPQENTRALNRDEIDDAISWFVAAAIRAEQAGFDGVQLHGAHGYLLGQFLDGRHNHRTDGWGGSFENRSRIFHEIIDQIRATTGPDFHLGVRLTPQGAGITVPEAQELATTLMTSGKIDHLDMSLWDVFTAPDATGTRDLLIEEFTNLPRGNTRLGVAGKILSAADAAWCLDRGADFVSIGTAGIIHADFPAQVGADSDFQSTPQPVSADHLERQDVGPAFLEYLSTNWTDFVH